LLPRVLILVIFSFNTIAGEGHSEEHANEGMSMAPAKGMHMDEEEDEDHEGGGDHSHSNWVTPPSKYASLRYGGWSSSDSARAARLSSNNSASPVTVLMVKVLGLQPQHWNTHLPILPITFIDWVEMVMPIYSGGLQKVEPQNRSSR